MTDVGPMKTAGNYRIQIYGPKEDGTYVVEFDTEIAQSAVWLPAHLGNTG